jgi:HD-GYP domain-containing protein (c-di-GMP phosphodiesterase class II)
LARIVAVADAFDAMTSHRPYHENQRGKPPAWAFAELERQLGKQFDPVVGAAFIAIREQVMQAMLELLPDVSLDAAEPMTVAVGFVPDPRG